MKNTSLPTSMGDVPLHVYELIQEFLIGPGHVEGDLRKPHIRASIRPFFLFTILMYAAIVLLGVVANTVIMLHIVWHKLCKDPTYAFIINNAVSDVVKCVVVLPISLYVLMVQNWMLGELLCSFLPMMQDIPLHVTTLTFLLTAWDRYRFVRNPNKPRLPAFVCAVGSWLTALCLVLPYPIYIIYVDLGRYSSSLDGIGFCVVNLTDDMQEYMRGIFLIMYAGPLATISYLYVKSSHELQTTATMAMYETRHRESRSRPSDSQRTSFDMRSSRRESDLLSQYSRSSYRNQPSGMHRHALTHYQMGDYNNAEIELDVGREKRTNKYLAAMVTAYAVFMCPLMILRVARLALLETYENAGHFDLTYTAFVWLAFLPTISTPVLYGVWHMSRPTKERLRGYFRISSRKARRSCDTAETSCASLPSTARPSLARTESARSASRHHPSQPQPKHAAHPEPPRHPHDHRHPALVHHARQERRAPPPTCDDGLVEIHPDQQVLYSGGHRARQDRRSARLD